MGKYENEKTGLDRYKVHKTQHCCFCFNGGKIVETSAELRLVLVCRDLCPGSNKAVL